MQTISLAVIYDIVSPAFQIVNSVDLGFGTPI